MLMLKVLQKSIVLLVLVTLMLTGCGFSRAPADEEAQVVEATAAVEPESKSDGWPTSAEEAAPAEEPASEESGIAPADSGVAITAPAAAPEKGAVEVEVVEKEAEFASEEAGGATVVEAMPLPTASPSMADLEAVAGAPEMEEADEVMAEAEFERAEAQQSEPLQAGEVDDNAHWDDYLFYRRNYRGLRVHDRDVSERYIIEVKDGQGNPVLGATVRVFLTGQQHQEIYEARTYANGQVLFHPLTLDPSLEQVDRFLVEVQQDNLLEQFTLTRINAQTATSFSERWTVTLDTRKEFDSIALDVLFLIDATGSMADEIAKIQSTIFDVSARIDALPGQPNVRYGLVTYRDRGDSFVTHTYEFTPDVRDFSQNLNTVYADGGGDYPESLNEGLHQALNGVEWRSGETVQLIFLIADAPPHLDYAQDYDYAVEMEHAARRGIKVFPIASSGLDDQGEYIFRQIAQYTQGRFIFLTYEGPTNGGAPGEVTTHHVDDYSVENLDDLLVRLVEEELAYQSPQLARMQ